MNRIRNQLGLAAVAILILTACGGSPVPTQPPNPADFFPVQSAQTTVTPLGVRMAAQSAYIPSDAALYGVTSRSQIVVFYNMACTDCLKLRTALGELNDEYQQVADFLYLTTDDPKALTLATQLNVKTAELPVVLFFDPDSLLVARVNGLTDKASLRANVEKAITVG